MAKPKKNVDAADRVTRLKAAAWSILGGVLGALMMVWASILSEKIGGVPTKMFALRVLGGGVFGSLFTYFVSVRLTSRAAETIGSIYHPSGSTTPPVREYSKARAMTIQGRHEEAAAAWELNCVEYPDDPVPYMELARLYRNEIKDYEQSVRWYRRAIEDSNLSQGQLLLATQEIAEIYIHKLEQPQKAIPHLADFVSRFPDDPNVDGAKKQLNELRAGIRKQEGI
jgi:hypothetical protein